MSTTAQHTLLVYEQRIATNMSRYASQRGHRFMASIVELPTDPNFLDNLYDKVVYAVK